MSSPAGPDPLAGRLFTKVIERAGDPSLIDARKLQWLLADVYLGRFHAELSALTAVLKEGIVYELTTKVIDGTITDQLIVPAGLQRILSVSLGQRATRLTVAIGDTFDVNGLQVFISHPAIKPFAAKDAGEIERYIRWV